MYKTDVGMIYTCLELLSPYNQRCKESKQGIHTFEKIIQSVTTCALYTEISSRKRQCQKLKHVPNKQTNKKGKFI